MSRLKPRTSRRVPPLKDSDYDHEINLLDHSGPVPLKVGPEDDESLQPSTSTPGLSAPAEPSSSRHEPSTVEPTTHGDDGAVGPQLGNSLEAREGELPAVEVERK